ncbi:hypothetical protein RIF29_05586 [Crotalaria pallida]|uniref:SUI1 domain-containing protein n=1 Tax=Crotalaria pallida TaxID=3830 RepID=A0AAN9P9U5_CROPI
MLFSPFKKVVALATCSLEHAVPPPLSYYKYSTISLTPQSSISLLLELSRLLNLLLFLSQLFAVGVAKFSIKQVYMVELEIQIPTPFDPFAEAKESDAPGAKEYVHIRIQQRNGKKSLTTVQGLKKQFSYEKILKDLKKEFCCNGNVVQDKELGKIIQLQGDQRKNVSQFLVQAGLVRKDQIKIHGF